MKLGLSLWLFSLLVFGVLAAVVKEPVLFWWWFAMSGYIGVLALVSRRGMVREKAEFKRNHYAFTTHHGPDGRMMGVTYDPPE